MTGEYVLLKERGTEVECKGGFFAVSEFALKFRPKILAKQVTRGASRGLSAFYVQG